MVGWHHQLNGHEFEQTLGDSEGQGNFSPNILPTGAGLAGEVRRKEGMMWAVTWMCRYGGETMNRCHSGQISGDGCISNMKHI